MDAGLGCLSYHSARSRLTVMWLALSSAAIWRSDHPCASSSAARRRRVVTRFAVTSWRPVTLRPALCAPGRAPQAGDSSSGLRGAARRGSGLPWGALPLPALSGGRAARLGLVVSPAAERCPAVLLQPVPELLGVAVTVEDEEDFVVGHGLGESALGGHLGERDLGHVVPPVGMAGSASEAVRLATTARVCHIDTVSPSPRSTTLPGSLSARRMTAWSRPPCRAQVPPRYG